MSKEQSLRIIGRLWVAGEGQIGWSELDLQDDPTAVKQAGDVWCEAASGEMLLADRGIKTTQHLIVQLTGITDKGINEEMLIRALTTLDPTGKYDWRGGFVFIPNVEARHVFRSLNTTGTWGAVIRTQSGYLHMVVINGLDSKERVIIRDPASGRRYHTPLDEFLQYWTEVAVYAFPLRAEKE